VSYSQHGSDTKRCGTPAQRTGLPVFPAQRSRLLETLNNLEQNIAELLLIKVEYKLIYYMIIEARSTSSAATVSTLFIIHNRASALLMIYYSGRLKRKTNA
jgi:hypothetical protein